MCSLDGLLLSVTVVITLLNIHFIKVIKENKGHLFETGVSYQPSILVTGAYVANVYSRIRCLWKMWG